MLQIEGEGLPRSVKRLIPKTQRASGDSGSLSAARGDLLVLSGDAG